MTSRLSYRGLHGVHGINPDLVTLGKYLGGGASFGAFGGRADVMDRFDPSSPQAFSHGGTFNNNVLSMAAGLAGFTQVLTEEASRRVNDQGDRLRASLNAALDKRGVEGIVLGSGSLMNLHFVRGPVDTPAPLDAADPKLLELWHVEMLLRGQHVTPRGMLALSLPFGQVEADRFVEAFEDFLDSSLPILPLVYMSMLERLATTRDTTHSRVYAGLRSALMNGDFLPGQRLVVRLIAERFETSAMPVREALRQLVSDEALFDHPHRGVIVPEATVEVISDLVRVRCSIEGAASEWAASTITADEIEAIDALNRRMIDCAARGDAANYLCSNREFHFSIYRASRSQVLQPIIERLWLRAGPWLNIMRDVATLGMGLDHHAEILDSLLRGDGTRARKAMVADISDAADIMMRAAITSPAAKGRNGESRRAPRVLAVAGQARGGVR